MNNTLYYKVDGIQATVLPDGRWLLHDRQQNSITTLNATAGILWELCDGQTNLDGLVDQFQELYPDTAAATLRTEIASTLPILIEQGLIQDAAD